MTSVQPVRPPAAHTADRAEFVRFSLWHRAQHWLLVAVFVGLLTTGLPQKFADAEASSRIINALGGIDNTRFLHRVFACIFIFESLGHAAEIAVAVGRRRFRPTLVFTSQDFADVFAMLRYSLGLRAEKPQFDRYDYRQKFEYWGIVFGAGIMIVSGLTLWFPTYVTRLLPGEVVPTAKEMHTGEALLAMLVVIVWHLYDVVFSPSVLPLDTTMITGKISRERLQEEHPREYLRLVGADVAAGEPAAQLPDEAPRQPGGLQLDGP
ncbi:MAG TPA: cytochrome b/b6 domain-containing protein [Dehalococcoidia bacterium]|nr:cytochrome b/b6 domain-containing protein [Dehalococcoidia bacterium]